MYPKKDLTADASTVMDYDPRLYDCFVLCQAKSKTIPEQDVHKISSH